MPRPLTDKQLLFVKLYCSNGYNASKAYRDSYPTCKANYNAMGAQNLAKPNIKAVIDAHLHEISAKSIATREQRQAFWTRVYNDDERSMSDRLRASELLGKSEADFTENIQTGNGLSLNFKTRPKVVKIADAG